MDDTAEQSATTLLEVDHNVMKASHVDWTDQASRFAYSDWLEEQGRDLEAEWIRQGQPPPIASLFAGSESIPEARGDGFGYADNEKGGVGDGEPYGYAEGFGDGEGYGSTEEYPAGAGDYGIDDDGHGESIIPAIFAGLQQVPEGGTRQE